MGLNIVNHKKLLGCELFGSGSNGIVLWKVTSIQQHLMHYVIFLEQPAQGWERKVTLHKHYETNRTGFQYKLECGTSHIFLVRSDIQSMDTFLNKLEYFI